MKFFKRNIVSIILIVFFLALSIRMFLGHSDRVNSLQGKVLFTISKITFLEQGKGGPWYNYSFVYLRKVYSSRIILGELSKESKEIQKSYIGKKYFVKFSVEKPKYSELYLDKPVPEDFVYKEGQTWEKLPALP
ncbi:hypothetical protein [Mariniflexile maritimum]|jgi:hypothetical protein|uniref:hypothetical protein n=1 Tax=Mariniflexile maritimum TaxID=2682493 RepID=UPI0012F6A9A1|nr:hypothetical protein [Mariniflexile maritimum]